MFNFSLILIWYKSLFGINYASVLTLSVGMMEYEELDLGGGEPVGSGTFGDVFKGFWNTKKAGKIQVAIKRTTNMEDEKEVRVTMRFNIIMYMYMYVYRGTTII